MQVKINKQTNKSHKEKGTSKRINVTHITNKLRPRFSTYIHRVNKRPRVHRKFNSSAINGKMVKFTHDRRIWGEWKQGREVGRAGVVARGWGRKAENCT